MNMKTLIWVVIGLLLLDKGCELIDKAQAYKKEAKDPYTNMLWEASPGVPLPKPTDRVKVGFNWDNGMTIYQDMLDTMQMVAGKWYSKSNLPKKKPLADTKHTTTPKNTSTKEVYWLRPTGREKRYYRTPEEIREYKRILQRQAEIDATMKSIEENADADDRIIRLLDEHRELNED